MPNHNKSQGMEYGPFLNTLRPRQNGRHFADGIFRCIFLNENVWISINISLKFVLKGPINNIPALVQIMAWRRQGDKPLSEPMMVSLLKHICVTRPQWVNCMCRVWMMLVYIHTFQYCMVTVFIIFMKNMHSSLFEGKIYNVLYEFKTAFLGTFYEHKLTLMAVQISILHFIMDVITHPCWGLSHFMLVNGPLVNLWHDFAMQCDMILGPIVRICLLQLIFNWVCV